MNNRHTFHPSILREYDIRGIIDQTLFPQDAYYLGRIFGEVMQRTHGKRVAIGRDGRLSSSSLEDALAEGLYDAGLHVLRVGLGPTPLVYYAEHALNANAAIMVTGSHNPPSHNGFKISLQKKPFYGKEIQELQNITPSSVRTGGSIEKADILYSYINRLLKDLDLSKPLTTIWDAANGATGEIINQLPRHLPGKTICLYTEIDGTFPHHHPDPTVPENLTALREAVTLHNANVGLSFDGDGDRLGVVDHKGRIIWGDQLLALFAQALLKTHAGAHIIVDVKASQAVFDIIKKANGMPLMWKTGHSNIKSKMQEIGALLAGEMSGHFFFADKYYGFDDGLYAALRVIELLSQSKSSLAELFDTLPRTHSTPEIRIPCPEDRKFLIPEEIKVRIKEAGYSYHDVDGIRVNHSKGWWLLRASHTQDVLVARCEANSEKDLLMIMAHLEKELQKSEIDLVTKNLILT